jgi:hypothetical protein
MLDTLTLGATGSCSIVLLPRLRQMLRVQTIRHSQLVGRIVLMAFKVVDKVCKVVSNRYLISYPRSENSHKRKTKSPPCGLTRKGISNNRIAEKKKESRVLRQKSLCMMRPREPGTGSV